MSKAPPIPASQLPRITYEELFKHGSPSSLWIVIHGRVCNVTPYLALHPGGQGNLMKCAGMHSLYLLVYFFMLIDCDSTLVRFYTPAFLFDSMVGKVASD